MSGKSKNIIIGILIVIIILLVGVIILDVSNKVLNCEKCKVCDEEKIVGNDEEKNNNLKKYDESDFIRTKKLTLLEPECTGLSDSTTIVEIKDDGFVYISNKGKSVKVSPGNAKYLYSAGGLVCDDIRVYYITSDNELYFIENIITEFEQRASKVTVSKVVEFLGEGNSEIDNGYEHYMKVLLENGEEEYVYLYSTVK